jgi:hypothetical protein
MTDDTTRQGDWNREQYEGEGQDPNAPQGHPADPQGHTTDQTTGDRWTKTEYPGDQGHGRMPAEDPDQMPEGESGLSGDRHTGGESHFARGQATDERNA